MEQNAQMTVANTVGLGELVWHQLSPLQQGWLQLAEVKNNTFADLQKAELNIQGILAPLKSNPNITLTDIQIKLKEAVNAYDIMKEQRLYFTNTIKERLIDKAMEFEKRSEFLIAGAKQHELTVRIQENERKSKDTDKNAEITALAAHIENEHFRIAAIYRASLTTLAMNYYKEALRTKVPLKTIPNYIESVKGFLREVTLSPFVRFPNRKLVTDAEAQKIFSDIRAYDPAEDLEIALRNVHEIFAMYQQDSENAIEAIQQTENLQQEVAMHTQQEIQTEVATNNLMAEAKSVSYLGNIPSVKKVKVIEIENTPEWAISVIEHFVKNWHVVRPLLKVKTWGNLKLEQMAAALATMASNDNKITFAGLNLKDVSK